jgi:acyl-CoA reductase-like NAD-dependent aldehyde dehydrogenase
MGRIEIEGARVSRSRDRVPERLCLHASESSESGSIQSQTEPLEGVVRSRLTVARRAQAVWCNLAIRDRLRILTALRFKVAQDPSSLAAAVGRESIAETLAAEVLPLLDACRFLEHEAPRVLTATKASRRSRPTWLWGTSVELIPEPLGVALVIGPSNYPLMLPGIQVLQAVAAGNCVLVKPAANCTPPMQALIDLAESAGLPAGVIQFLPESPAAAATAIRLGVDKVFLTGSATTGQEVSRQLAASTTPAVLELSGCDAMFVLDDADPELVSDCLVLGLTLNRSQTCMAPRRVFASDAMTDRIIPLLKLKLDGRANATLSGRPDGETGDRALRFVAGKIEEAISAGAQLVHGSLSHYGDEAELSGVAILDRVTSDMSVTRTDLFAPVLSFLRVADEEQALHEHVQCPLVLSASVFGSTARCQLFARRIHAGCVTINDLIVPTADPRVPFGGRGQSGHGMTRGAAGLMEMTRLKVLVSTRPWFKPHLKSPTPLDADVMAQLIQLEHSASALSSLRIVPGLIQSMLAQLKFRKSSAGSDT